MDVSIEQLTGDEINPYIELIGEMRIKLFKAYPYLYEGRIDYEKKYLQAYAKEKNALLLLVRVDGDIVGLSTGMPLKCDSDIVHDVQALLQKAGEDVGKIFYYGETVLLPEVRGKGIYSQIVKEREFRTVSMGYSQVCFLSVVREINHPLKPENCIDNDKIFSRMGYKKTDLTINYDWPTLQADGSVKDQKNPMVLWRKVLTK